MGGCLPHSRLGAYPLHGRFLEAAAVMQGPGSTILTYMSAFPARAPPFRGPIMMALIEAIFSTPSQYFSILALSRSFLLTHGSIIRQKPFPQGSTVSPCLSLNRADPPDPPQCHPMGRTEHWAAGTTFCLLSAVSQQVNKGLIVMFSLACCPNQLLPHLVVHSPCPQVHQLFLNLCRVPS